MGGTNWKSYEDAAVVKERVLSRPYTLDDTAVDSGNSDGTHILRKGLCLGVITATGKLAQYDDTAVDGTEDFYGILLEEIDLKDGDPDADAADHPGEVLVMGDVYENALIGIDDNGKADVVGRIWFS